MFHTFEVDGMIRQSYKYENNNIKPGWNLKLITSTEYRTKWRETRLKLVNDFKCN